MNAILTHPNYNEDDHAYLRGKGWTDQEIIARWTEEHKRGDGPCRWDGPTQQAKLHSVTRGARGRRMQEAG